MREPESGHIDVERARLEFRIEGEGKPAVVIGSARYYPKTFSHKLQEALRLHFLDHRGFVKPCLESAVPCSLELLVDDLEKSRKRLGLEQFILIGHSGNGYIALEYAKKYPQHVTHLVLIALGPDQSPSSSESANAYFEQCADEDRKEAFRQKLIELPLKIQQDPERRFVHFCLCFGPRSWYDHRFDASALWQDVEVDMAVIDHVWGEVFRDINIACGLENFSTPVFLALGRHDYLVAPYYTWDTKTPLFKDLTLVLFEKSSHCPQMEEADLFDSKLLSWIKR